MNVATKKTQTGFTLIELMMVVAVIAVLAAIAYPSYQDSVRKTKRAEAKSALLENAQRLERCFTTASSYLNCTAVKTGNTEHGNYSIGYGVAATAATYTLTATAQGAQASDFKCATFSVNEKGVKTATGTDSANCW